VLQLDDKCAVLIDGGPGGLAAAWAASACQSGGGGQPVLMLCIPPGSTGLARQKAAEKLVDVCAIKKAIQLHLPDAGPIFINEPAPDADARRVVSHLLLDACTQALKADIQRLIWPIHSAAPSESELRTDTIADACDRSLLAGQLASLDAPRTGPGSRGVCIETPYADFTDLQLAELIVDMSAPRAACAWCEQESDRSCGGKCGRCRRWAQAFKRVGSRLLIGQ
jgi:hypothetical protein